MHQQRIDVCNELWWTAHWVPEVICWGVFGLQPSLGAQAHSNVTLAQATTYHRQLSCQTDELGEETAAGFASLGYRFSSALLGQPAEAPVGLSCSHQVTRKQPATTAVVTATWELAASRQHHRRSGTPPLVLLSGIMETLPCIDTLGCRRVVFPCLVALATVGNGPREFSKQ